MTAVVVTGASGFVGKALCAELLAHGHTIRAAVRSASSISDVSGFEAFSIGEVGAATDWSEILDSRFRGNDDKAPVEEAKPVDCVVHCAARAHVMNETETDALTAYRAVNVDGTRRLAEQAVEFGVKRLVYLSSIKVNGERTSTGVGFTSTDFAKPEDP
jgi:nucleoside-diphosphate-sugar epimerase